MNIKLSKHLIYLIRSRQSATYKNITYKTYIFCLPKLNTKLINLSLNYNILRKIHF